MITFTKELLASFPLYLTSVESIILIKVTIAQNAVDACKTAKKLLCCHFWFLKVQ